MGGDINDPRDAILGAANYLHRTGASGDLDRALFAYNHSARYVRAIRRFADRMRIDERTFLAYYAWQVYVRTAAGVGGSPALAATESCDVDRRRGQIAPCSGAGRAALLRARSARNGSHRAIAMRDDRERGRPAVWSWPTPPSSCSCRAPCVRASARRSHRRSNDRAVPRSYEPGFVHCPSEATSRQPSTTLIAVCSSMASASRGGALVGDDSAVWGPLSRCIARHGRVSHLSLAGRLLRGRASRAPRAEGHGGVGRPEIAGGSTCRLETLLRRLLDWAISPAGEPPDPRASDAAGDASVPSAEVRTFLIADIRGYTRFTQERGDPAAALLARKFASVVRAEGAEFGVELLEL
jgi:hypothetical protein